MSKKIKVALIGNPNCGKTTLFNNLVGARQHVGNYPGVTVEKKEGSVVFGDAEINMVDLPGTYSLTAYAIDEIIARNYIIEEKPDVVIDVVDSSNLERHLYLATQLMEMNAPLILAFNMHDQAEKLGLDIDHKRLSELFGAPIINTVATKRGPWINQLLTEIVNQAEGKSLFQRTKVAYDKETEEELSKLDTLIQEDTYLLHKYPIRWLSIKTLEGDQDVIDKIKNRPNCNKILEQKEKSAHRLNGIYRDTPETIITDHHYGFVNGAYKEAVKQKVESRHSLSDHIDRVLVSRVLGLPIFFVLMWAVFKFTFSASEPLVGYIETVQEWLSVNFGGLFAFSPPLQSLIVDGVINGVGSVLVFVPMIFTLFLALAFLEDSGYMARAAFIMDRFMHKIGLHGRSFIPMLLGFGCNVAGIMATRSIEDKRDRYVTILINSFMSCSARFPVYVLFIAVFFPKEMAGNVMFSLYLLGIVIAIIVAKVFRKFLFKGESVPFVMELPPYRVPTVKGLLIHMWQRGVLYLKKAGTIIFAGVVVIWFLCNFPQNPTYSKNYDELIAASKNEAVITQLENEKASEKLEKSYSGRIGKAIQPIFKPLGFGDWKISVGLIGGVVAKEIVISTLGTLYSVGEADEESVPLRVSLKNAKKSDGSPLFTPVSAYAFLVFILLYIPCIATIAVIRKETSWVWALFAVVYTTGLAWIAAFAVYQGSRLLGIS